LKRSRGQHSLLPSQPGPWAATRKVTAKIARPFLILQHVSCEPPGAYGAEFDARGLETVTVELDHGDSLPTRWDCFAGIVAMGGPMGVYDIDAYPWLVSELRLIEEAVKAGVPFWGVCLGAQLLAAAMGGTVSPGAKPEVGVLPIRLTTAAAEDEVFSAAPAEFAALQWHGDTYSLPSGATNFAESDAYPQQTFRVNHAYGLQFHLEASDQLVADWIALPAYAASLEQACGPGAYPGLARDLAAIAPAALPLARCLFGRWLDRVVEGAYDDGAKNG
jgi:GMP synthase (glutamine-hydrolysing)